MLLAGTGWGNGRAVSCQLGGVSAPVRLPASPCPEGRSPAGPWVPGPGTLPSPELQSHMVWAPLGSPAFPPGSGLTGPGPGVKWKQSQAARDPPGASSCLRAGEGPPPGCQCEHELEQTDWMGLIKAGCPGYLNPAPSSPSLHPADNIGAELFRLPILGDETPARWSWLAPQLPNHCN